MKHTLLGFLILAATNVYAGDPTTCPPNVDCMPKALQVDLFGKYTSPKQEDYDAVRNAIGSLVADMKLHKFLLRELGIEGGFSVCLEPTDTNAYNLTMERLAGISVDTKQTIFETRPVENCK